MTKLRTQHRAPPERRPAAQQGPTTETATKTWSSSFRALRCGMKDCGLHPASCISTSVSFKPMQHQRLLSISTAALALLSTLLLGMGQMDASLPLLMLTVAVTSVYFTDILGWFRLNRTAASVGALIACRGWRSPTWHATALTSGSWRSPISSSTCRLSCSIQEKTTRVYWQLLAMSLLQVVVAAVLNLSVIVRVLAGRLSIACLGHARALLYLPRDTAASGFVSSRSRPARRRTPGRLASAQAVHIDSSTSSRSMRTRASHRRVDWGAFRTTAKMALTTLAVTVVIFFSVPRFGGRPWRGRMLAPHRMVGFSQTRASRRTRLRRRES